MHVIGTAGHVDHGKSTLVEALTGINPDRLKEERERQMTIDLGFAWLTLPNGQPVGIVDVPGHRDFIENMLAGVGSLDAVLFVVAADEGVMPQTREHLAIMDLLQIPAGVVVVTKADLVDADWLELVTADLAGVLRDTVLADAPVVPVSARTRAGLSELKGQLQEVLAPPTAARFWPAAPANRPRLQPGWLWDGGDRDAGGWPAECGRGGGDLAGPANGTRAWPAKSPDQNRNWTAGEPIGDKSGRGGAQRNSARHGGDTAGDIDHDYAA